MVPVIFCHRASGCEFLGRPIVPVQEPRDELVHARGRPQIDEPGQDVDELSLRIDSGQLAVPTSSTVWVSRLILDAAHPGKLDGSPTPGGPNHLFTRRRRVVQGTGVADSGPCRCTTNVCGWGGWKVYDYKEKREPLEDRPGWGSLSNEWKI